MITKVTLVGTTCNPRQNGVSVTTHHRLLLIICNDINIV